MRTVGWQNSQVTSVMSLDAGGLALPMLKGNPVEPWKPVPTGVSSLTETMDGYVLCVESSTFVASNDTRALGVLCFAYGLDSELFPDVDPHSDVGRWLVWHFCALLSRREDDPDLPAALQRALAEADGMAPSEPVRRDVRTRVEARLCAIAAHYGGGRLATLQAIREAKAGAVSPSNLDEL